MSRPQNRNYKVAVTQHGQGAGTVFGWVPEQFALRLQNKWEQFYANLLENSNVNAFTSGFGSKSFFMKSMTGHVWMGTEAIEFQMQLQFDADTDVIADVHEPVEKLISWASPSYNGGGFISAPGPNLLSNQNRMSLRIGNFLYFDSVIIPNLDITWHSMMHHSGVPIAADVEISFRTFYTMTREDILAIFSSGRNSGFDGVNGSVPGSYKDFVDAAKEYGNNGMTGLQDYLGSVPGQVSNLFGG